MENKYTTTTLENTIALVQEFFDGIGMETHYDGQIVNVYRSEMNPDENPYGVVPTKPLERIETHIRGIFIGYGMEEEMEEMMEDWRLLLDRWDFAA